jgi:hypothetical protein
VTLDRAQSGNTQTVDVKVSIPELTDIPSFFLRGYATHHTFEELYQECVNHPSVVRAGKALERVPASRHLWHGDRMMLRNRSLDTALRAGPEPGSGEISLVLRRDLYRIGPTSMVSGGAEYVYMDAEAPIEEVIARVLTREERPCCVDLCNHHKNRLGRARSLADYELLPAPEGSSEAFPDRAVLFLRPRISALSYVLLVLAVILGVAVGYGLLSLLFHFSRG